MGIVGETRQLASGRNTRTNEAPSTHQARTRHATAAEHGAAGVRHHPPQPQAKGWCLCTHFVRHPPKWASAATGQLPDKGLGLKQYFASWNLSLKIGNSARGNIWALSNDELTEKFQVPQLFYAIV